MLVFVSLPETDCTAERRHIYSHIECDVCEKPAPTTAELAAGKSLMERGWYIDGGQHRCPEHYHEEALARGPQYR